MEAELQTYLDQLAYVNLQLETDPENDDLLTLKTELNEIIDLTKSAIAQTTGASTSASGPSKSAGGSASGGAPNSGQGQGKGKGKDANWQDNGQYKAGADCMAKYKDGKWSVATFTRGVFHDG